MGVLRLMFWLQETTNLITEERLGFVSSSHLGQFNYSCTFVARTPLSLLGCSNLRCEYFQSNVQCAQCRVNRIGLSVVICAVVLEIGGGNW